VDFLLQKTIINQKEKTMERRRVLKVLALGAVTTTGFSLNASASPEQAAAIIKKLVKSGNVLKGKVHIHAPDTAENGKVVPVSVSVDSPMTDMDYVKSIHILAEKNPLPEVISVHLTPDSGAAEFSMRTRLSKTQKIAAVAVMSNGAVYMSKKAVKVTIGGCGG